jgi:gamma-glutamyltranspeptidase/glutathione hydrolase
MTPEDAVNFPKFHHQWLPDEIFVERDFNKDVIDQLKAMGYKVTVRGSIGRTEVIMVKDKTIIAVADHRGDDGAAGY